jgi:hypothetical protein
MEALPVDHNTTKWFYQLHVSSWMEALATTYTTVILLKGYYAAIYVQ